MRLRVTRSLLYSASDAGGEPPTPPVPGDLFVPVGSDSFITSDGDTFRVTPS